MLMLLLMIRFPHLRPITITINLFCCFLISVTDVLTAPGWGLMVRCCSRETNSTESNIKYFSATDLQPFTTHAKHFYGYDLLSPSFMQIRFENWPFVFWPSVTLNISARLKQLANEHVTIRNEPSSSPQRRPLKSPERKTSCSTSHIHSAVMTLSTKQLKRTALRGMFLQKASEESRAACSTSPLTDSTLQGSHAAGHAHWSSLTRLTFPGPHGWLAARCARPGWKGHTTPCRQCQRRPPRTPLPPPRSQPSREQARWMLGTAERQPLNLRASQPQNKGMPSEFGSDIRLVFPTAPLSGVKIFVTSGLLRLCCKRRVLLCKGAFFYFNFKPFKIF